MRQNSAQPAVSIIVPIFNEEENLPHSGEVAAALEVEARLRADLDR